MKLNIQGIRSELGVGTPLPLDKFVTKNHGAHLINDGMYTRDDARIKFWGNVSSLTGYPMAKGSFFWQVSTVVEEITFASK